MPPTFWFAIALFGCSLLLTTVPAAVPVIRVGISRTPDEIVCHYVPWYQGTFYQTVGIILLFPSCLALGVSGLEIVAVIPALVLGGFLLRQQARRRRSQLRIGRSELAVSVGAVSAPAPIVIPRGAIQAIDTKRVDVGEGTRKQLSLVYGGVGAQPETIKIGPGTSQDLSVKLQNLERALAEWKNGSTGDPELLDRVETLLRGRRLSG